MENNEVTNKESRQNLKINIGSERKLNKQFQPKIKNKKGPIKFYDVFENEINYVPSSNVENKENICSREGICYNDYIISSREKNDNNQFYGKKTTRENNYVIDKIRLEKCWVYVFFFCVRKRNNINNILLEEAMRIITEHLDIINVFKRIYKNEEIEKLEVIKMSDKCKNQIEELAASYH